VVRSYGDATRHGGARRPVDLAAAEHAARALFDALGDVPERRRLRRAIGLSKLARVVEMFARGLQVQERLTTQVAAWLDEHLAPQGVGVVLEAEHACMSLRGVQKPGARTVTSALHGRLRDDPRTRQEFLSLTGGSRV